jgi:solute:Na+ symporter, SSS family
VLLRFQSHEHLPQISSASNQYNEGNYGERGARYGETDNPEVEPVFHQGPAEPNYSAKSKSVKRVHLTVCEIILNFTVVDWVIVALYLTGSVAAGLFGKWFVSGVADFLVAGRELDTHLGVATLSATEIGTVTFMYYAQLGYKTGFASFVAGLISGLVMIFIGRTGFIVKKLRAARLMTIPEYFEARYSRRLRVLAGLLVATGGILNMGVFLKIEGTFLSIISGIPLSYLKLTMTGILALELIYTVLGGMVSIVITDFIQFGALSFGTVLVTLFAVHSAGFRGMYRAVASTMGKAGFDPLVNPEYGLAFIIFQVIYWLAIDTCWQTTAMRTFSARDPETSRRVFSWTGFIFLGRGMMPMMWGIAALALLGPRQDSLEAMPRMLSAILPPVVLGLVVSGMLAATMSVNSSYLLGWSAVIAQDIVLPLRGRALTPRRQVLLNRVCNVLVSLFVLYWGLWYSMPSLAYLYLNITATIFLGGTFSAVLAGLYWRRSSTLGAYFALSSGALAVVPFFFWHFSASYSGLGSFTVAALGMVVGSLLSKQPSLPENVGTTDPVAR